MNLSYSDEQRLLKDSVEKLIQQEYDFDTRRKIADSEQGFDANKWQTFAELGWLAVPFSEELGGLGGGPVETMILMESFGKALVLEPWMPTVLMSGHLLETLGNEHQKQNILTSIIQGEMQCSVAHWEQNQRFDLSHVETSATQTDQGYRLSGEKQFVFNGQNADQLIVSARVNGSVNDEAGIALFIVTKDQPGLSIKGFKTLENGRAANVILNNVEVSTEQMLGSTENLVKNGPVIKALQACFDLATFAACAEAVGIMEILYKTTVEYANTRKQFGVPIGKFQALQHRMVNMFILHEQSQSLLLMAAIKLQEGGQEAEKAVSALKAWIGQAGRKVGQEAVQLHGGIGMTDELNVGYYFKRLTAIDALFGNVDYHLDRYANTLS